MQSEIQSIVQHPIFTAWDGKKDDVLKESLHIQSIPAPTFHEQERARYVKDQFESIGLHDVRQDDIHNVLGRTPGSDPDAPAVLVSAHLDTVFPHSTPLDVTHNPDTGHITGPGLGDNSVGLAAMLALARAVHTAGWIPGCDIWWAASVGEEGLGNLQGMRHIIKTLKDSIGLAIILEGMGIGRVYHAGLGVRRLRVTITGPGGHSWQHADRPSAIHHLMRLGVSLIDNVRLSRSPRTSFNIGLIEGGTSINTRAPQASMSLDMRSEDAAALARLENDVRALINGVSLKKDVHATIDVIGDRPAATLPVDHPLVQAARIALKQVQYSPVQTDIGSTDANIPLAEGIPTVCIGITRGGNAHTINEFIDTAPLVNGLQQMTLLVMLTTQHSTEWRSWDARGS